MANSQEISSKDKALIPQPESFKRFIQYIRALNVQETIVWNPTTGEPVGEPHQLYYALYLTGYNEAKNEGECERCKDLNF